MVGGGCGDHTGQVVDDLGLWADRFRALGPLIPL